MARVTHSILSTPRHIATKSVKGVVRGVENFFGRCKDVVTLVFGDGGPPVEKWGV